MKKSARISITVLLFAHLSDILGGEVRLAVPVDSRVSDAIAALIVLDQRFAAGVKGARAAVNGEWADPVDRLRDGDELALTPPVSGG